MQKIEAWLERTEYKDFSVEVASADASFRRYFRLKGDEGSYILMDASLEKESLAPFIDITERLLCVDVRAPKILLQDLDEGFLIIDDFGSTNYLDLLDEENFKRLYTKAMEEILKMQQGDTAGLPLYDKAFLHVEMDLMKTWFLEKYVKMQLSTEDEETISKRRSMPSAKWCLPSLRGSLSTVTTIRAISCLPPKRRSVSSITRTR